MKLYEQNYEKADYIFDSVESDVFALHKAE